MTRPLTIVLIAGTALACLVLVYCRRLGLEDPATVAKVLAASGYLAVAINAGALRGSFGRLLFIGLVLCWVGDMLLIGHSQRSFLLRLVAFLFAHLAFIAAFLHHGISRRWLAYAFVPLSLFAIGVIRWLAPHTPAALALPVHIYIIAITLMAMAALAARGAGAPALTTLGALLFLGSDLSVAALRIVGTDFPTYIWGQPMYFAGQLCFAVGAGMAAARQDARSATA